MCTTYPDLEPIWPGWKTETLLGKGLGGSVYRAVRSMNGLTMESAVKITAAPKEQSDPEAEVLQASDIALYKSKADDGIAEISYLLELKSCRQIINIEDFALAKRDDDIRWNVYIRMELLRSLTDYLAEKKRLNEDEIIRLGLDLSEALMQFEKKHIVHRDIKLENVYITDEGCYKLGDFGIAIRMEEAESASKKGNQNYMAPEVFWKRQYGKTTDLYSLGILLYLLSNDNKMPFFDSDYWTANQAEKDRAFDKRVHGEDIPDARFASREFNKIILKACSYEPENRYPNAESLYEDLKNINKIS